MALSAHTTGRIATLLLTLAGGLVATPRAARANSAGITGRSGKQGATCTACHSGGVAPEVVFVGPSEVLAGETATFSFELHGRVPNQRAGGFNVAASGGRLGVVDGEGERLDNRNHELTHAGPRLADENRVVPWVFLWTAPDAPGSYTLFGAGNSVNLNGQSSGDRSSTTTFAVIVVAAVDTPTPTPTPSPSPVPETPTVTATVGPVPCVGDCDDGNSVTVNELVTGVNITLGNAALSACQPFDADGNGAVTVNELIAAVNAALGRCIAD